MAKTPLSLNPDADSGPDSENETDSPSLGDQGPGPYSGPKPGPEIKPVIGWCAVGFGVLGIFTKGYIFVPLSFICSLAALFMGQAAWAFVGILLSVVGFLTSPVLLALIGMGWLAAFFGLL
ncbi:MAG: hypothetical protein HQ512_11125 [Rhodospirillales bacterium]|nr:hypothetical protein [Rhodospirillales bacterium]